MPNGLPLVGSPSSNPALSLTFSVGFGIGEPDLKPPLAYASGCLHRPPINMGRPLYGRLGLVRLGSKSPGVLTVTPWSFLRPYYPPLTLNGGSSSGPPTTGIPPFAGSLERLPIGVNGGWEGRSLTPRRIGGDAPFLKSFGKDMSSGNWTSRCF